MYNFIKQILLNVKYFQFLRKKDGIEFSLKNHKLLRFSKQFFY
jgi:hypothetical protein